MVTNEYTPIQWQVRQLTNSDPWATPPSELQSFIDSLSLETEWQEVIDTIKARLDTDQSNTWRNCYKALVFLDHILKHAPVAFTQLILADETEWIEVLEDLKANFKFVDEKGKDEGVNVRVKAGSVLELITDKPSLVKVRKEEQEKRERLLKRREEFQNAQSFKTVSNNSSNKVTSQDHQVQKREEHQKPIVDICTKADDEDDFSDFQSATPVPAKADTKTADPFEDLLKL